MAGAANEAILAKQTEQLNKSFKDRQRADGIENNAADVVKALENDVPTRSAVDTQLQKQGTVAEGANSSVSPTRVSHPP